MRILAALCLLLLPAMAQAQWLGQKELNAVGDQCIASCQQDNSFEACAKICHCVQRAVANDWKKVDYEGWDTWLAKHDDGDSLRGVRRACERAQELASN